MFNISEERERLSKRYADLERQIIEFPELFLTHIADLLFFEYNLIHVDVYNTPELEFWLEADKFDRFEIIDAYYGYRGTSIYHSSEIVHFESLADKIPTPYLSVYIPFNVGKEAFITDTDIDKRKLRKLTTKLKSFRAEFSQLKQEVDQEQAQVKLELEMLRTYKEVAGGE